MSNKYRKETIKGLTRSQVNWRVAGVIALTVITLAIVLPGKVNAGISWVNSKTNIGLPTLPASGFNLGLDLQGGAHLIYAANTTNVPAKDRADSVEGVRDVIERRVRGGLGVAEPMVQTTRVGEEYRVIVELPGITDVNQAIKMIGETPVLEFKEENTAPQRELTKEEKKQLSDFNIAAEKKAKLALTAVRQGKDFAAVVTEFSEDEKTKNTGGDIGFINDVSLPEVYKWASTHKDGETSNVLVKDVDGWNVVKRLGQRDGEKYVSAAHLLLCYQGAERCEGAQYTKEQALEKIKEIKTQITVVNFGDMVAQYSTEPGAKDRAGDLGKFKSGEMVPEFESAAFGMAVGAISDPVESQFGYHLIYKKGEEITKEYQVARVLVRTKTEADIVPPAEEWKFSGLSGKQLKRAEVTEDMQTGQIQVSLNFDEVGTKLFADITTRNANKLVAIFLDGEAISIPRVDEPILSGSAVISGGFTLTEAKILAQRLNSGALPVPVEIISQQTVGASLGADSLQKSFVAGLWGLLAVVIFVIFYYRLPGLIASVALLIYVTLTLAIFKLLGVTLTLSGIAGFILSIGMAVDANVLIFERLKEELRLGRSLSTALEESFVRAWSSIRDSNITTLISCVFLLWMGTGFVQGFAITLAVGVLMSMFSAIVITRNLMRWILVWFKNGANHLFLGYKKGEQNIETIK